MIKRYDFIIKGLLIDMRLLHSPNFYAKIIIVNILMIDQFLLTENNQSE